MKHLQAALFLSDEMRITTGKALQTKAGYSLRYA